MALPGPAARPPAREAKPAKPAKAKSGSFRRIGILGIIGLAILVLGLGGFLAAYNYDTWIKGESENNVGQNQQMAVLAAAGVAAIGGGLFAMTLFGLGRHRGQERAEYAALEAQPPAVEVEKAPSAARAAAQEFEAPAAPPARQASAARAAPPASPAVVARPAIAAVASVEAAVEEDEEEEEAIELPAAPPRVGASLPREVDGGEATSATAVATGGKDELEDLFGELENEVAATDEEEVHYECPNCHGIVLEDDTTCPHCQVVFEGS